MSSTDHEVSFARGAYVVLAVWTAFAIVGAFEAALLVALQLTGVGTTVRTVLAAAIGQGVRAILLVVAVRSRPRDPDRLEAWKPIVLTIVALVAVPASRGLHALSGF